MTHTATNTTPMARHAMTAPAPGPPSTPAQMLGTRMIAAITTAQVLRAGPLGLRLPGCSDALAVTGS
jgi:hypothetical protein